MKEYFNGFSTQDLVDMKRNDEKQKEKVEMKKEIERLKEEYVMLQNASDEVEEELQQRIDKAIEYIEENKTTHECNEWGFDNMLEDIIPLLDILKGVDKE